VNVCGLATAGDVRAFPVLENTYGRNPVPPVPTGCNVNPLYNPPGCNPVIVCGLVVEEIVPVTVFVPVNVYMYDVILTPDGRVGAVQVRVAVVEFTATNVTAVGAAICEV
jgi:hypothetical protein